VSRSRSRKSELSASARLRQCVSEFKYMITPGGEVLLSQLSTSALSFY
jgi:hypothetical protein